MEEAKSYEQVISQAQNSPQPSSFEHNFAIQSSMPQASSYANMARSEPQMGQPRGILHDTLVQRTYSPRRGWRERVTETITYRRDESNLHSNESASSFQRPGAQVNP